MLQPGFCRYAGDHIAKSAYLQIFHLPGVQHQRSKFLADETHLPLAKINSIEMFLRQSLPKWILCRRKHVNQMEHVRHISPKNLLVQRAEPERFLATLLRRAGAVAVLQS